MTLHIDPRAGSADLIEPMRALGIPVEEKWLNSGDISFTGRGEGGVYAVLPPGRLVPTKTRLFLDAVSASIKAGWQRH